MFCKDGANREEKQKYTDEMGAAAQSYKNAQISAAKAYVDEAVEQANAGNKKGDMLKAV